MPSSLLNAPHPNTHVHHYELARDPDTSEERQREMKARAFYFAKAAAGDAEAKLMLKSHPRWRLSGWYNRDHGGDVIGTLSKVVKERKRAK